VYPSQVVTKPIAVWATLFALAALPSGCEDEDGPLRCPEMTATGGNPVGRWEPFDTCFEPDPNEAFFPACPEIKLEYQGTHTLGGTVELTADGTYHDQSIVSQSGIFEVPLRCVPQVKACGDLGPMLQKPAANVAETEMITAFCRGSDTCKCVLEVETHSNITAPYRLDGATYFIGDGKGEFSVVGNELRIQEDHMMGGGPKRTTRRYLRLP
jgi:hypothetical protein